MRISRDEMFMQIAQTVAKRGTCDRAQVGAVLVENGKNIVAIGYNGSPSGQPHCDDVGHLIIGGHCVRTLHAEENCIRKLGYAGYPSGRLTLYITHYPCMKCVQSLVIATDKGLPLKRIVYGEPYRADEPVVRQKLLGGAGIEIEQLGETLGDNTTT